MLSIRDLLFTELEERAEAVESLRRYIGGATSRAGPLS